MIFKTVDFTNKDGSVTQKSAWTFGGSQPFAFLSKGAKKLDGFLGKVTTGTGKISKFTSQIELLKKAQVGLEEVSNSKKFNSLTSFELPGLGTKALQRQSLLNLQKLVDDADLQAVKDFNKAVQQEGVSVSQLLVWDLLPRKRSGTAKL